MNDPTFLQKMADFRRKAADGTISLAEMREAVSLMRAGRVTAATTAAASKRSTKPAAKSADELLGELDSL